ncbi:hypothetical protein GGS21DRAFT_465467 [Xylaria nigripes]|nr:hypothetical protein GGS21DRAFT_465467 [Xylaria nigripes]
MVYCGKASQGCQGCRTRRIKCDKKQPECSQCIRIGRKCPGYRDQLSLMFRDESSKVIQKAHAQWGIPGSPSSTVDGDQGSPTSPKSSPGFTTSIVVSSRQRQPLTPSSTGPFIKQEYVEPKMPPKVEPNLDQRGLKFYMERYLLNHPDSPRTPELRGIYFGDEEAIRNVMIAVGLAGMSNLLGNKSMNMVARSKYVTALKQTGQLIASVSREYGTVVKPLRSIVTLALFEVVQGQGSRVTAGSANTHVHGAVALLRSALPVASLPNGGARGTLQLMFSMFIPSYTTRTLLPPGFFECLKLCKELLRNCLESCDVTLAFAISSLLKLFIAADQTTYLDDRPETDRLIKQYIAMGAVFDRVEQELHAAYPFVEYQTGEPSAALFRGKWHRYSEIWGARIWNHYRWARILLGERIVQYIIAYPLSGTRCILPLQRGQCYATIGRVAEDILISTSAHWHHPMLDEATAAKYEAPGQGGAGAAGLPSLLWHLNVAGCAPNVPPEFWDWAHNILQVVWKSMGMQHAMELSEVMKEHRKRAQISI